MDLILYQIFKIITNIFKKKHGESVDNASIQIYVNKIENIVTFNIKSGYNFWHRKQWSKIIKDKNGENVPHLEIAKVVLVHCNMVNNDYQQDLRVLYTFVANKPFVSLLKIVLTNYIFVKTSNFQYLHIKIWFTDQNSNFSN